MQVITKTDWTTTAGEASLRRHGTPELTYVGCHARQTPYGTLPEVPPARLYVRKIDRAEWPERIRDRIARRLFERTRQILPNHNQENRSSCWVQAPIRAVEICRFLQGMSPHLLSPESVLIPIDGARDRGGDPLEAILQLQDHGACHQKLWPANDFNSRHADPLWETDRTRHKIIRFVDLRDWEEQISFALHDLPHVIALEWWKHAVCGLDPELIGNNDVGIRIDNSWGQWGDQGTKVLDEESGTAADWGAYGCLLTSMEPLE